MMDLDNFEDYIAAYIDEDLSSDDRKCFEDLMSSNEDCRTKFDETLLLLNNLKSMPTIETEPDFSARLHQKIRLLEENQSGFLDRVYSFLNGGNPAFNFALSFGAIAIFSFIYLNDLNVFRNGIKSAEVTKGSYNEETINIELAGGIDDQLEVDDELYTSDNEEDSLESQIKSFKFNIKNIINDVVKEVKIKQAFNKENE